VRTVIERYRPRVVERDELCGRTVGEFVLRERIGEGGCGAVYRCEQRALGREAVVKVMHRRLRDDVVELHRFMREAQLASQLDHPYAAHVYAFGIEQEDGLFWIAMELVHGTALDRWLATRGPLPLEVLIPLFNRVAEVVETAHQHGIIHRDLKPSNVMVIERAGRLLPKLLDFGIAKLMSAPATSVAAAFEPQDERDAPPLDGVAGDITAECIGQRPVEPRLVRLTLSGAAMGSPPYMSPEQWTSSGSVGPRSDLYALGVIAYEALTGRRPFHASTKLEYAELHRRAEVPPVGDQFPRELDALFRRALAKRPEDRPASALALAAELRVASGILAAGHADPPARPGLEPRGRAEWMVDGELELLRRRHHVPRAAPGGVAEYDGSG
jgi:serine/threonine-protein kinase